MSNVINVFKDDRGLGIISVEGFTLLGVVLVVVLAIGNILTSPDGGIPSAASTVCSKVNESIANPSFFGQ